MIQLCKLYFSFNASCCFFPPLSLSPVSTDLYTDNLCATRMTSSSNKPDSLPFPRPLGKPSHRRTQSSSLLPTRSTTSSSSSTTKPLNRHQHTRSKSWLSNWLSKPTTVSSTTTNESSSNTKNITNSSSRSRGKGKVLLKDIVNSEPAVVVKGIKHARGKVSCSSFELRISRVWVTPDASSFMCRFYSSEYTYIVLGCLFKP